MLKNTPHIVILGNGISGVTAARHVRKLSDARITIISKESDYFFSRTALMYIYMGHMEYRHTKPYEDHFWKKNRIDLVRGKVESIDFKEKKITFDIDFKTQSKHPWNENLTYDKLILACGSSSNVFDWEGVNLDGVNGLYSLQDLQYLEGKSPEINHAVIVGGGLIGIELAEMLHTRNIPVSILVREKSFWNAVLPPEESEMVNQEIKDHKINLLLETELDNINGEEKVSHIITKSGDKINCEYVGLTVGVHPNINFLKSTNLEVNKGILVDDHLQTNITDVYAIGDCAQLRSPQKGRKAIEAVWYTGRMMGEIAAYNACNHSEKYNPGTWFNSAKFFTIEYQVYGQVPVAAEENHGYIYWQHEDGKKSVRIYFEKTTQEVKGFLTMGVRYRQEICIKWIEQNMTLKQVLPDLKMANFDPEFYKSYEQDIIQQYNTMFNEQLSIKTKKGITSQLLSFLKKS